MRIARFLGRWTAVSGVVALMGCGGDPTDPTGSGGTGGDGGTGATTTSAGGGGTGGEGGGTGGAGGGTCEPGETKACYSGPPGTDGVGLCKAGVQTCKANGDGFGPCTGEVVPTDEVCSTAGDDDCDGQTNEGGPDCSCVPGDIISCYSGPPETQNQGPCVGGTQVCNEDGMGYGPCTGEIVPQPETCDTLEDDDCDGKVNEEGPSCVCPGGELVDCYTGPIGTQDVGECKAGKALCAEDGKSLGPCMGQVTPAVETCNAPGDEDCDGMANEDGPGCQCSPGTMVPCYTGPAGTLNVGICQAGMQECGPQGMPIGQCVGQVTPAVETCETPGDEDCDGQVNEDGAGCTCVPGSTLPCYTGPAGTQGVGACKAGTQTCASDGLSYGACMNQVLPAAENCNTPVNEDCLTVVDCGTQYWAKAFGAPSDQQAYAIARDAQNNAIITGRFTGIMSFGGNMLVSPNGYDIFVAKLDTDGNHVWSRRFGDSAIYQEGFDVAVDAAGDVFVTGYFDGSINFGGGGYTTVGLTDIFVIKLDGATGNHVWSKAFGAAGPQYGASLAVDSMGNVGLLAAGFNTLDFGGGPLVGAGDYDTFLVKLDGSDGGHIWSKRYGGTGDDRGLAIAVDSGDNFVITGRSDGTLDFGGGPLPTNGVLDAFAAKVSPTGNLLWAKRFGDGANQFGVDVAIDAQDNVLLTGGYEGTINLGGGALPSTGDIDVFVAKLGPGGNHLWSKHHGAAGANVSLLGLGVLSSGDVMAVGSLEGALDFGTGTVTSAGTADGLLLRIAGDTGNVVWSRLYGGTGAQFLSSIAADGMNDLLIAGYFEQSASFGGDALTSSGGLDILLTKLAP